MKVGRRAARAEARRSGNCPANQEGQEKAGPRSPVVFLPWLLLGLGSFSHLVQGKSDSPWLAGLLLLAFNSLYISVVFRAFDERKRRSPTTLALIGALALVTGIVSIGFGESWLAFIPLLSLAAGSVLRGRRLVVALVSFSGAGAAIGVFEGDAGTGASIGYSTFISGLVTAMILSLAENINELRSTRQELARSAVEQERLRFSRDLHDLLGHTLSVIVVKSEAARRIAPRDFDLALAQVADIEAVGRQALTEIREAVTGYREGSLTAELDGARDVLTAAGVEPLVRQSGPPLPPHAEALLGWVVREAATNVVRHAGATRCEIDIRVTPDRARMDIADNGGGAQDGPPGSGLKGLAERLAAAGGSLEAGPEPRKGFRVRAELPIDGAEGPGDEREQREPRGDEVPVVGQGAGR
ncbi:sensor histidine kinase [Streptomyces tsukubensis]|uniref:sensor histidine kinase n=1 Tax=Streptomyces tsukubensis TaxID=83656 RepID=UPI000D1C4EF9|nr:sensor histidine kinase [Streptomyces tsukubensis]